jgi:hypothetical protein
MNLLNELDSFKNNQKIISYNQSTNDIINAILRQHNKSLNDYDKLYYFFDGGNICNTARKVFNYLKDNVKYIIEPDNLQTVKSPSAILATGKTTGSDCKNFSLFFAGIMDAYRRNTGQKFDLAYRFASYDGSKTPEHVFVVINPGSENEIWCDAVLDYFNEKKQPNYYKDKKLQNMALMALSGINEQRQPQEQMGSVLTFLNTGADKINKQTSGLTNFLTASTSAIPVFGSSISSLISLVGPLFAGHSDSYILDHAIIDRDWDKAMGTFFTWYQNYGFDVTKKPWSKVGTSQGVSKEVPQPYLSLSRFEWLPLIWQQTKNTEFGKLINEAINQGYLDKKYFINSKNEMAPEPTVLSNLFGGGSTDGKTSSGISTPLILGGVAAVGLIVYFISKKKK